MRVAPEAACATKSTRVSNHRYTASAGIPCAMVLTGSFVLFPVTGLFCHRHLRNRFRKLSASVGAPEPHDFAVRTNAARRAMTALGDLRPSHPAPNVRDDREPPLLRERDGRILDLIWVSGEAEYFCKKGWTATSQNCPSGKSRRSSCPSSAGATRGLGGG